VIGRAGLPKRPADGECHQYLHGLACGQRPRAELLAVAFFIGLTVDGDQHTGSFQVELLRSAEHNAPQTARNTIPPVVKLGGK
jgi:hypothetical protein